MVVDDSLVGEKAPEDIKEPGSGEVIVKKMRKITKAHIKRITELKIKRIQIKDSDIVGKILASNVMDPSTGEVLLRCNEELTIEGLERISERGVQELRFIYIDEEKSNASIKDTLLIDKIETEEEAIIEIYRRLRPSNPPTPETAHKFFNSLFFDPASYDLSDVGRAKMNYKLRLDVPIDVTVLRNEDILAAVKYLIDLKNGARRLQCRRYRSLGKPQNQVRGRTDRKSIPHRSGSNRKSHQGENEPPGH